MHFLFGFNQNYKYHFWFVYYNVDFQTPEITSTFTQVASNIQ